VAAGAEAGCAGAAAGGGAAAGAAVGSIIVLMMFSDTPAFCSFTKSAGPRFTGLFCLCRVLMIRLSDMPDLTSWMTLSTGDVVVLEADLAGLGAGVAVCAGLPPIKVTPDVTNRPANVTHEIGARNCLFLIIYLNQRLMRETRETLLNFPHFFSIDRETLQPVPQPGTGEFPIPAQPGGRDIHHQSGLPIGEASEKL
jgi:hypothetical protein